MRTNLDESAFMHVAPEPQKESFLRSRAKDYLSEDLYHPNVMAKMDIVERFQATVIRAQDFGSDSLIEHRLLFASTDEVFVFRKL